MLSPYQFHGLSDQLRKQGGFTVNVNTGEQPSSGVAVAEPGNEVRMINAKGGSIANYAAERSTLLSQPGMHLGGWDAGPLPGPPGGREGGAFEMTYDSSGTGTVSKHHNIRHEDVLDVSRVIPEHPLGHHIADVHHRMHVNRQDAAFDLGRGVEIPNPRAPYGSETPDEYGSTVRIVKR